MVTKTLPALLTTMAVLALAAPAQAAFGFLDEWGSAGAGDGRMQNPEAVAVGSDGAVYVADTENNRVQRFTSSGRFGSKFGSVGFAAGQFRAPRGIATGAGNIYVADTLNNRIQFFSPAGAFLGQWGTFGAEPGQFEGPEDVATDSAGNVYVLDAGNSRVQVFSSTGTFLREFAAGDSGQASVDGGGAIAVDTSGDVFVADTLAHRIIRLRGDGSIVTSWGSRGTGPGQLAFPSGIAVTPQGAVHVSGNNERIDTFSTSGAFIGSFGSFGGPVFGTPCPGRFSNAEGVATDSAGNVYVADTGNDRIQKYGEGGRALKCTPVLGKSVVATVVSGRVLVSLPGAQARAGASVPGLKGRSFTALKAERVLPVGTIFDTRRGTARIASARDTSGKTQAARFASGVFQVLQSRSRRARGLTELRLKGASFSRCRRRSRSSGRGRRSDTARSSRSRTVRRLRSSGRGRFRVRGRNAAATVRGTVWTTSDRCDGTLTRVTRGKVAVRDFRRRRTIVLTAGKSYLARAPR